MIRLATVVALLALPHMAWAGTWLDGVWCEEAPSEGPAERIFVDEFGIGFNEHTICDWSNPPTNESMYRTVLSCRNIHLLDGEPVVTMVHEDSEMRLVRIAADRISVRFDDNQPPVQFRRCN